MQYILKLFDYDERKSGIYLDCSPDFCDLGKAMFKGNNPKPLNTNSSFVMRISMEKLFAVTLLSFALHATPLSAQEFGPQPDSATKQEILDLREKAWRTWFSNDHKGFKETVPEELMAMGWGGGPWQDRAQTLQSMNEFATGRQMLATLEFPKNIFQHYGDVIVLYTSFRLVLKSKEGVLSETKGRGTEIFVKRNGKWIHTGWHLDNIAS